MEVKNCRVCASEISSKAVKCIHCDSFQNWRRYLNIGSNFLALIIALISVSTVLFSQLKLIAEKKTSNSYVEAYIINKNGVSLIASNTGNMPSFIHSCKLEFYDNNQLIKDYNFVLDRKSSSRIIEPGEITETFYEINSDWLRESICNHIKGSREILHDEKRFKCKINWVIASYDSTYERISIYEKGEKEFALKDLIYALQYSDGGFECMVKKKIEKKSK